MQLFVVVVGPLDGTPKLHPYTSPKLLSPKPGPTVRNPVTVEGHLHGPYVKAVKASYISEQTAASLRPN